MTAITQQELEDAAIDAQSLEDFINGAADINGTGVIFTRLGRALRTVAKVIEDHGTIDTTAIEAQLAAVDSQYPIYESVTTASATTFLASQKSMATSFHTPMYAVPATLEGGARYRRATKTTAYTYPSALILRSVDRFDPDGTEQTGTEGGWWINQEDDLTPYHFGVPIGGTCGTEINQILDIQGFINLPEGTFILDTIINLTHKDKLSGAGKYKTIIKAADNFNTHMVTGTNTWQVVGSGTFNQADGSNQVEISNLTLDGNKDNQTAGNGIFMWGFGLTFKSIILLNIKNHAIHTEFTDTAQSMEGCYEDILIFNCGRDGWRNRGPHDFHGSNIRIIDSSADFDNSYYGIRVESINGSTSNGRLFNCHVWHTSSAVNRNSAAYYSTGGVESVACHYEGCRRQVVHQGSFDRMIGCFIYAPFGANGDALVTFNGNDNQHALCSYLLTSDVASDGANNAINGDTFALYFNSSGNMVIGGKFNGFKLRSPLNFEPTAGLNQVTGTGYCAPGGAATFGGIVDGSNSISYTQGGTVINYYKPQKLPGPFTDNAAAAAGGVGSLAWYTSPNGFVLARTT